MLHRSFVVLKAAGITWVENLWATFVVCYGFLRRSDSLISTTAIIAKMPIIVTNVDNQVILLLLWLNDICQHYKNDNPNETYDEF